MEETIQKIHTLQALLCREVYPGGMTSNNVYGLSPDEEKQIREKLLTLIKSL
jgi:hypothetical protein